MCRFNGHCSRHYSVAEHSILVALHVAWDDEGDGRRRSWLRYSTTSEAYLCDIPRPLKLMPEMAPYREMEAQLEHAIAARFGLPYPMPDVVRRHDARALATEYRDLVADPQDPVEPRRGTVGGHADRVPTQPLRRVGPVVRRAGRTRLFDINRTERLFLAMYRQLSGDERCRPRLERRTTQPGSCATFPLPSLTPDGRAHPRGMSDRRASRAPTRRHTFRTQSARSPRWR